MSSYNYASGSSNNNWSRNNDDRSQPSKNGLDLQYITDQIESFQNGITSSNFNRNNESTRLPNDDSKDQQSSRYINQENIQTPALDGRKENNNTNSGFVQRAKSPGTTVDNEYEKPKTEDDDDMDDEAMAPSTPLSNVSRTDVLRREYNQVKRLNIVIRNMINSLSLAEQGLESVSKAASNADHLLDAWVSIMSQTHHTKEILFDEENWKGSSEISAREHAIREEEERLRLKEERRKEEERERERIKAEERAAKLEQERKEKEEILLRKEREKERHDRLIHGRRTTIRPPQARSASGPGPGPGSGSGGPKSSINSSIPARSASSRAKPTATTTNSSSSIPSRATTNPSRPTRPGVRRLYNPNNSSSSANPSTSSTTIPKGRPTTSRPPFQK